MQKLYRSNLVTDLRNFAGKTSDFSSVFITGNLTEINKDGGIFVWDADSTAVDNGSTIIKPNAILIANPGRWIRASYNTPSIDAVLTAGNSTNVTAFLGDLTVQNLTVAGNMTTINSTTTLVSDNILTLNYGETGAGVTNNPSGIEIDRGTLPDYQFVFDEVSDTFRIGQIGSLQPVATREDSPINGGIVTWDNTSSRFITTAPSGFTGSFILNQNASAQTANAFISGQLKIGGVSAPVQKLEVIGTDAAPLNTGGSTANGALRIGDTSGTALNLEFGIAGTLGYSWIQSREGNNYGNQRDLRINPNGGTVSIGTTSNNYQIVFGLSGGTNNRILLESSITTIPFGNEYRGLSYRGTSTSRTPILSGDVLVGLLGVGQADAVTIGNGANIQFMASENWSLTARGTNMLFSTVTNGTSTLSVKTRLHNNGNWVMNDGSAMTDAGYRLDVFGTERITGTNAAPATSGSAINGSTRFAATGVTNIVLDVGVDGAGAYTWIQARDGTNYNTPRTLVLNPNNGLVQVGTTASTGSATFKIVTGSTIQYSNALMTLTNNAPADGNREVQIGVENNTVGGGGAGTFYMRHAGGGAMSSYSFITVGMNTATSATTLNSLTALYFNTANTTRAHFSSTGVFFLDTVPATGSAADQILVRTSGGEVRQITAAVLGGNYIQNNPTTNPAQAADFYINNIGKARRLITNNTVGGAHLTIQSSVNQFDRWNFVTQGTETGGNAGSDLVIQGNDDAGVFINNWLVLKRSNGLFTVANAAEIKGGGEALKVGTSIGASDNTYIGLYARQSTPTTQSAQIGYTTSAGTTLEIKNLISGGAINLLTTGTAALLATANSTSITTNTFVVSDASVVNRFSFGSTGMLYQSIGTTSTFILRKINGTSASPTPILSGNILGSIDWEGSYSGANTYKGSKIISLATENWSVSAAGTKMEFYTIPNGTITQALRMTIGQDGNVGIGVSPTEKLHVAGTLMYQFKSSASAPTTSDIPASYAMLWKNTTSGEVRLYSNDGGTLKSVLLT